MLNVDNIKSTSLTTIPGYLSLLKFDRLTDFETSSQLLLVHPHFEMNLVTFVFQLRNRSSKREKQVRNRSKFKHRRKKWKSRGSKSHRHYPRHVSKDDHKRECKTSYRKRRTKTYKKRNKSFELDQLDAFDDEKIRKNRYQRDSSHRMKQSEGSRTNRLDHTRQFTTQGAECLTSESSNCSFNKSRKVRFFSSVDVFYY